MSPSGPRLDAAADLRTALPATHDLRFLNYAATAPMLDVAAAAMTDVARENLRPLSEHFSHWLERVERARRAVAELIEAGTDEITFTTSTSAALSRAAGSVRWRAGDRVLYPADEFPSNRFVWDNLRGLGVRAEPVPVLEGVRFADQLAAMDLSGVRLVAFSAVSYRDGRRHEPASVARVCAPRGILTCVDAIQAVGAIPVSVRAWNCDFAASGGQKWLLGPVGSGFLFVRRALLDMLHVPTVGWASSRHAGDPTAATLAFCDGAARFEGGLPCVAAIAGLHASIERLRSAGWPLVHERLAAHRVRLADGLRTHGLTLLHDGAPADTAGIVAARVTEEQASRVAEVFATERILATQRSGELRLSAHATTSDDDVDACLAALGTALGRAARAPRRSARVEVREPAARADGAAPPGWRHALVTGASRGLGAAIAGTLAARGTRLTLLARDLASLEALAAKLKSAHGAEVRIVALDLADEVAVSEWAGRHRTELEDVDLLVNNAAMAEAAPFLELDPGHVRAAFGVNVFAPMALARALLPTMMAHGRGTLLNVVAAGARNALPLFASYAASKGALWSWSESLARELDGTGVQVTTFVPPRMDTATRNQLARRAVAWFGAGAGKDGTTPVARVADMALEAAAGGRRTVVPRGARWQLALSAIAPGLIERAIRRRWSGGRAQAVG